MPELTQSAFTSGELDPSLHRRLELAKFDSGATKIENFFVHTHGGVSNRPGFEFVAEVKDSSAVTRLIPFEFNTEQTYKQWEAEKEVGAADYLKVSDQLSDKTIEGYETLKGDAERKMGKQNLVYGTAQKVFEDRAEDLTEKIMKSRSNLWDNYQRKMSDLDVAYEGDIASLESQYDAADYEQRLAEASSEQWYPWKYTSKFLKTIVPGGDRGILDDPSWT